MKLPILSILLTLLLTSCYKPETTLHVIEGNETKLELLNKKGDLVEIPVGSFEGKFKFKSKKKNSGSIANRNARERYAELQLNLNEEESKFRFDISDRREFLYTNAPLEIKSSELGQPVDLVVSREVEKELDRINVRILAKDTNTLLATMQLINENGSDKQSYDEERGEFLQSYQSVKLSQRSLVFEIDGALDQMFYMMDGFDWVDDLADNIVNYGAAIYISPWVYARYWKVNWILSDGSDSYATQEQKWQKAINESPVVDYVSWVHAGSQYLRDSWVEGKKEHQLRMVYIGACDSRSSSSFITRHNAAVASGHRNTSASPLFQFSFFRNWAYGRSFKKSIGTAWVRGKIIAKALEFVTFAKFWQDKYGVGYWRDVDDMLYDSEMMISYTKEMKASDLNVSMSSAPKRDTTEKSMIIEEEASELVYGEEEEELISRETAI